MATDFLGEGVEGGPDGVSAAKLGGLEAADDVLECGGHHKVLLLEPQLLSFKELNTDTHGSEPRAALSQPVFFDNCITENGSCVICVFFYFA